MKRISEQILTVAIMAALSAGMAYAGGEAGKTKGKTKGKAPARQTQSAKPRTKAKPGTAVRPGAADQRREDRFRRKYTNRPGAATTLKKGQRAQTDRQNRKGKGNQTVVDRTTRTNRGDLQHRGDISRTRNKRGQMRNALGRAGSPSATKAGMRRTGTTTPRGAKPRTATPSGKVPVAMPKGAKKKDTKTAPKTAKSKKK